ncbi:TPA: penicillin-insensitive murein endopeptidase [Vibrio vulnificus]|nr:penicillin-insensitive murein endopeptidase [Vibrio vulnificus]
MFAKILASLCTMYSIPIWALQMTAWELVTAPTRERAQSIGSYANGCLDGGVALPLEGAGYQVVRTERNRYFAHPETVTFIQELGYYADTHLASTLMIADVSLPRGGRFSFGHASHQTGLDIDVWLKLNTSPLNKYELEQAKTASVVNFDTMTIRADEWRDEQFELIRAAAENGRVARIFVHAVIKQRLCQMETSTHRSWLRKVRPWWGHSSHMHVRLSCPQGSDDCIEQALPPEGDGCGEEVLSWIERPTPPAKKAQEPEPISEACVTVLNQKREK